MAELTAIAVISIVTLTICNIVVGMCLGEKAGEIATHSVGNAMGVLYFLFLIWFAK